MAQPKMDWRSLFEVLQHKDENPMITKSDLAAWAKRRFPRDEFIASQKFISWVDGGKGGYLEREMHSILVSLLSLDRTAQESVDNLEARDKALRERDEARELAEEYRKRAESAKLQLALMTPPPADMKPATV